MPIIAPSRRASRRSPAAERSIAGLAALGIDFETFSQGRAPAKWRNQCLAWFLNRLPLAQAVGQGIQTILRTMREEGCPPPIFEANQAHVICTLPAHPRHVDHGRRKRLS